MHLTKPTLRRWMCRCCLGVIALPALLLVLPIQAGGKLGDKTDPAKLTLQRIFASVDFTGESASSAHWMKKMGGYVTQDSSGKAKGAADLVHHDPETGKKEVLVEGSDLVPPGGSSPLSIESFEFAPNEALLLIFSNSKRVWRRNDRGDFWVFDLTSRKLRKLGGDTPASTLQFAKVSPDSKKVAYVKDKNVFVEDLLTGKITQLSERKTPDIINGTFDWVYEEELDLRNGIRWSPDSRLIAYWQLDTSGVKDFHMINNTDELYPKITTFKYPKVGEQNSAGKIGVAKIDGKSGTTWLDVPGDPRNHYLARMNWAELAGKQAGQTLMVQQLNRLQNTNKVLLATFTDKVVTIGTEPKQYPIMEVDGPNVLLTETDKAWLDVHDDPEWFDHGQKFLWLSERIGWRQAYAVSRDGKQQKLITPAKHDVMDVLRLDDAGGWLYYYASPDNATQKYLFRAKLDGSKQEKLTPEEFKGTNSYNISPDAKWAVHTHSAFDTPPVTRLVKLPEHKEVRLLAANKKLIDTISKLKRKPHEFFRVDIGDGVELDGWCIKPPDFDASKKYPVLFYVYGEPAGQTVLDAWKGQTYLWHLMLAQQGYLVMSVDNRGTPAPRGRDFRKIVYKQVCTVAGNDQSAAVKAIAKQWPWVDAGRVGVWGWSGGGTMSLHAIFRFPDVYHTAMSVAPVTNERFYDTIYSERYMGMPSDNVKGYRDCSAITWAHQLKGNLLLVHGTGDDNVHYANTEALVNELIAHNKQFSMMAYPNRSHSISEGKNTRQHLFTLMTNYLHKNLPAGTATVGNGKTKSVEP